MIFSFSSYHLGSSHTKMQQYYSFYLGPFWVYNICLWWSMIIHAHFIIRLRAKDKLHLQHVFFFKDDTFTAPKTALLSTSKNYHYNICLPLMSAEAWMSMIHMREYQFRLQAFILYSMFLPFALADNRLKLTWERLFICIRISVFTSLHFTGIITFCRQSLCYC